MLLLFAPLCLALHIQGGETPCKTVTMMLQAAGDVRDVILRAAARLNVPIRWLPDRIADSNFNLEEPPSKASPWVPILLAHLQTFVERLTTMPTLSPADVHQVHPIVPMFPI